MFLPLPIQAPLPLCPPQNLPLCCWGGGGGGGKTVVAPDIEEGVLVPGNSPLVAILPCLCP